MHYKFKFPRSTNRKQTQASAHDVMCAWLKGFILAHCRVFIKIGEHRGLSLIKFASYFKGLTDYKRRSQWPRDLRRRSTAAPQLRLWVRISPRAWLFVSCECCVLSGRVLRNSPITRPEETYRLVRRCVGSRNLVNEEALPHWGAVAQNKKTVTSDWQWRNYSSMPDYVSSLLYVFISHNPPTSLFVTYPIRAFRMFPSFQCFIGHGWTCADPTTDVILGILTGLEVIPDREQINPTGCKANYFYILSTSVLLEGTHWKVWNCVSKPQF
jgi:hypothetical protein